MRKMNEMVFSSECYNNSDEMWRDVANFLRLLTKNEYIATVRDDDINIIVIEYEHNELCEPWGCPNPVWLTEEEALTVNYEDDTTEINFGVCGEI